MDDKVNFDSDSEELKVFNNNKFEFLNKLHPSDEHFSELIQHQIQCKLGFPYPAGQIFSCNPLLKIFST